MTNPRIQMEQLGMSPSRARAQLIRILCLPLRSAFT